MYSSCQRGLIRPRWRSVGRGWRNCASRMDFAFVRDCMWNCLGTRAGLRDRRKAKGPHSQQWKADGENSSAEGDPVISRFSGTQQAKGGEGELILISHVLREAKEILPRCGAR